MNKNILVTGGLGYIGSHLCVKLLEKNYNVSIIDDLSNSKINVLKKIIKISKKKPFFFNFNINNIKKTTNILKTKKIDLVFHLAAFKDVNESINDPFKYYNNNIFGILNLIKSMEDSSKNKLIFSSSAVVYGKCKYLPIDEKHPTTPLSPYGLTKLFGEKCIDYASNNNENFKIISLRYFNPVGSHSSGELGDNPDKPDNIMPLIDRCATKKSNLFKIYGSDYPSKDGTAIRDYIHVLDVVDAHISALNNINKFKGHNIFNIGTGKGVTVLEILNTYKKINNINFKTKKVRRRKGDIPISYASVNKIKKYMKWKSKYNLKDMCKSSFNFAKKTTLK